jgi:putative ATP-dependent endonuclease of the OLD family
MRMTGLTIQNYRSIKEIKNLRIEPLQAFVGENNAGKSNILRALDCFLSSGSGGMDIDDLNDPTQPATIEAEFSGLSDEEKRRLRSYLIGDRIVLQKKLTPEKDAKSGKTKIEVEYHGYQAEPKEWFLSVPKIESREGTRPKWKEIAEANGFLDYVKTPDDKVTKTSFVPGLAKYLLTREAVEYDEPTLGQTQALGIPQNLLAALPEFYLLPGITDYSDEIDRRSSTTVFRRLMSDLADRIMSADARYGEIEGALSIVRHLLNPPAAGEEARRLESLGGVEVTLRDTIKKLMPGVQAIQLTVEIEETKEIFSKGVNIKVDDGVLTDVLDKGHGLQRSIVFALLQMLMKSKNQGKDSRPIILAIEEPELYIHPHTQRLIYRVVKEFAGFAGDDDTATGTDQVIYTTHCPAFIDISRYERVCVVRKDKASGTKGRQCEPGVLGSLAERKAFKLLTSFGLKHNELFFAKDCVLLEGQEDEVGIIATARKLGRFNDLPDEIGLSIVVVEGKGDIPKFQKVLNAFGLSYGVLLELDGKPETHPQTVPILENLLGNRCHKVPKRLEDILTVGRHFDDVRHAKAFFSDPANINQQMEELVRAILP